MFCQHCGRQLPDDAQFCTYCGESTAQNIQSASARQQAMKKASGQATNKQKTTQPKQENPPAKLPGKIALLVCGIILAVCALPGLFQSIQTLSVMMAAGYSAIAIYELLAVSLYALITGICAAVFYKNIEKGETVSLIAALGMLLRIIDWIWAYNVLKSLNRSLPAIGIIFSLILYAIIYYITDNYAKILKKKKA